MSERKIEELKKQMEALQNFMKDVSEQLNDISSALFEIRAWYRQTPQSNTKELLETILDSPKKLAVYNLSNGKRTTRSIVAKTGVGTGSVSRWWTEWIKKGIALPMPKAAGNRAIKLFELKDYGIEIPSLDKTGELKDERGNNIGTESN
ncbi:MAG: hypothetical protein ACTSW1_06525 [Candidatus Hodarchaeales archaeon]